MFNSYKKAVVLYKAIMFLKRRGKDRGYLSISRDALIKTVRADIEANRDQPNQI